MEEQPNEPKQEPKAPSGHYNVEYVALSESTFHRLADAPNGTHITNEINLTPTPQETSPDNKFTVSLKLEYVGYISNQPICKAVITMVAGFEKFGVPALTDDKFKKINAPAIIYPFIREHLYNLCIKAGLANILLPTVNFKP